MKVAVLGSRDGYAEVKATRCWRISHLVSSEYGRAEGPRWERTELRNCWVSIFFLLLVVVACMGFCEGCSDL